jgi:tetratricopeptide (TPR) repeat protein
VVAAGIAAGVAGFIQHRKQAASGWESDVKALDANTVNRCAAAARPAFAAGLQLLRDASREEASARFDEAATEDPRCAMPSLYYLLSATANRPRRREHFRRARELRATMNEREEAVLHVLEASVADPIDYKEEDRRTLELLERHPEDIDLRRLHERTLLSLGRYDDAATAAEAASKSSAPDAWSEYTGALAEVHRRSTDRAFQHFDACLHASPDSSDCLYWKGLLQGSMGQCSAAQGTFRQFTTSRPTNADAFWALGQILLTSAGDAAAARTAFEQRWRLSQSIVTTEPVEVAPLADKMRIALAAGDLEGALALAREWNGVVSSSTVARFRVEPLTYMIELLRELDRNDEARALAVRGLSEQEAWTSDDHVRIDPFITLARLAYLTGGIDAARFRQLRSEWLARAPRAEMAAWLDGYAGLPVVGEDIAPPIRSGEYALDWYSMYPEAYTRIAEQLTSINRFDDAVLHAEAAVNGCFSYYPLTTRLRAKVVLATAYERAGRTEAACRMYAAIDDLLRTSPRSVSRQYAHKRRQALSCPTSN